MKPHRSWPLFLAVGSLWLALAAAQAQTLPAPAAAPAAARATPALTATAPRAAASPAVAGPTIATAPTPAGTSEVFGAQLFTGAFAREGASQFNPDYVLAAGDTIQVRLWGAFEFDGGLTIDPQGNVFLPHLGPLALRGVRNQDLQAVVDAAVRRVFRTNVNSYASLAAAQPVRVFVSGFVQRPGLYSGTSMDGLLHYLDQAGGIDPERGSFLAIRVQRGGQVRATVNLYDFLLRGHMPALQLAQGDVILVPARQSTVRIGGLVANARRFEFAGAQATAADLLALAGPLPAATHLRIVRNAGALRSSEYHPLAGSGPVPVRDGDELEVTADKKPGTITVRVEGEHQSAQEYVLAYGSRLRDVLSQVQLTERSQPQNLQLFRQSVRQRQREALQASLRSLEAALLTARSGSSDEARLRAEEAALTLQWIERARQVEPQGQVQVSADPRRGELLLENGDVLRIPADDGLVLVSGEVLFPNAVAHQPGLGIDGYLQRAGGLTQAADGARIVLARADGSFEPVGVAGRGWQGEVRPGDQVLVLPRVDDKPRQFWKDMTQILYQIAVSAKVVLGL